MLGLVSLEYLVFWYLADAEKNPVTNTASFIIDGSFTDNANIIDGGSTTDISSVMNKRTSYI